MVFQGEESESRPLLLLAEELPDWRRVLDLAALGELENRMQGGAEWGGEVLVLGRASALVVELIPQFPFPVDRQPIPLGVLVGVLLLVLVLAALSSFDGLKSLHLRCLCFGFD